MEYSVSSHSDEELTEVYQRNIDIVYRLCYLYLKNPSDADDAVQSVFLKWIESKKVFQDLHHERAWLIVTTKNHCKNVLKHWWKSRRTDFESLPETAYWDSDRQQSEVIEKILLLPTKYKITLYLYYFEDYSVKELSKLLGRKESTIQSQLSRGRERLKLELGGIYDEA